MSNNYICLWCGRLFTIQRAENSSAEEKQKCPYCGGDNIVKHNPSDLLSMLMGGGGG
jgi:DNA-directed RNA polymerase subunit RPC12/RpoP